MTISPKRRQKLVVMVKVPRPGRVKTRLAKDIGSIAAAQWFRKQTHRLIRSVSDPRWELLLAVAPDYEGMQSRVWPDRLPRLPQGGGDLGDRMGRLFRNLRPGSTIIIGADIPGVSRQRISEAFCSLGSNDVVIGPATDGGFWLIGLKNTRPVPPRLFSNVRWSTKHAMADTVASLNGFSIGQVAVLSDVDTIGDLVKVTP